MNIGDLKYKVLSGVFPDEKDAVGDVVFQEICGGTVVHSEDGFGREFPLEDAVFLLAAAATIVGVAVDLFKQNKRHLSVEDVKKQIKLEYREKISDSEVERVITVTYDLYSQDNKNHD